VDKDAGAGNGGGGGVCWDARQKKFGSVRPGARGLFISARAASAAKRSARLAARWARPRAGGAAWRGRLVLAGEGWSWREILVGRDGDGDGAGGAVMGPDGPHDRSVAFVGGPACRDAGWRPRAPAAAGRGRSVQEKKKSWMAPKARSGGAAEACMAAHESSLLAAS
jgi:hypothetical protein